MQRANTQSLSDVLFFLSDGCMAQRGLVRAVALLSALTKNSRCILFCFEVATVQAKYEHRIRSAVSQRVPLSVLANPIASSNSESLRCSPLASSEAQPDHSRKVVKRWETRDTALYSFQPYSDHPETQSVASSEQARKSSPMRAVSSQEKLGEGSSTWRKEGGEERAVPSKSNPDALQKKREGGLKKETKLSSSTMATCQSQG